MTGMHDMKTRTGMHDMKTRSCAESETTSE